MSESLRDLVVSLSLNSDNFTRNIRSVNKQIQEAQSRFALAGAGVSNFERSTAGLSAKAAQLREQLALQRAVVDQYQRALTAANGKLSQAVARQGQMQSSLVQAQRRYAELGSRLELARARYEAWNSAVGEGDQRTQQARQALDALRREYDQTGQEIRKLEGQLKAGAKYMQSCADSVTTLGTNLNGAQAAMINTAAALNGMGWTKAGNALTVFAKEVASVGNTLTSLGRTLSRYVTTPILALGGYAIKTAMSMEDAFAGVRKTVDMTEAEYRKLDQAIRGMTLVKPSGYEDIAFVAETAGQLGVATQAIEAFTSVMTDLANVSTDLTAGEAATNLAKLANITGMAQTAENFQRLGSAILACGVNSASTEAGIVEMSMRLAAAGKQVGLSEAQIVGFATALSSVGIEAQMGGTAFSKALIKMEVACQTGGAALADFAGVAGLSSKQFKELFQSDPAAAFQAFIAGLAGLGDEGKSAIATLQEIGFNEVRLRDTTLRMVNANELLTRTQALAKDAWRENTAIADLVAQRYDTTAKRLEMLKNKARLAADTFSGILVPSLEDVMGTASGLLDRFMELDGAQRKQIVDYALMAAAAGPVLAVLGKTFAAVGKLTGAVGKFATAVGAAGGGIKGLATIITSSKLAVLGLTGALAYGVYALNDWASGAKAARDALDGIQATADRWRRSQTSTIYDNEGLAAFDLDEDSFVRSRQTAETWLDEMLALWSDGKAETDAVIVQLSQSFKALNDNTRSALERLRSSATASGRNQLADEIQADMDALDKMDAEIEALLKKRQNKNLTEKDELRLRELIDAKEAIEIKYKLAPQGTGGYQSILQGIEKEIARAQARGEKGADNAVYEQGLTAAAQGYAAVTREIDRQYDAEYALIQLMEEEAQRQAELDQLNETYNANRVAAAQEYANTVKQLIGPVWEQEGVQQVVSGIDQLMTLLRQYSAGGKSPGILTQMDQLFQDMDKDNLLSYIGLLQQVQALLDGGMGQAEVEALFPDLDLSQNMDEIAALADFAKERSGELQGLADILNNIVPQAMQTISIDLDMTAAQARWAAFANDPGAITTQAIIGGYSQAPQAAVPQPVVDALVAAYGEIEGGASTAQLAPEDVVAQVAAYLESENCDLSALQPDQVRAIVSAYAEATGADRSALLTAFTATITQYQESAQAKASYPKPEIKLAITGYDLDAYNAFVAANPVEITGILRLGEVLEHPQDVLDDPNAQFVMDGRQIQVDVVPRERITADTLFLYDADGTMHVLITPEIQGTTQSVHQAGEKVGAGFAGENLVQQMLSALNPDTLNKLESAMALIRQNQAQMGSWFGWLDGSLMESAQAAVETLNPEDMANLTAFVAEFAAAVQQGQAISQADLAKFQRIGEFVSLIDTMGIGQNVSAGIGAAMAQAGFESDAATTAAKLEAALKAALGIASPAARMMPIGQNAAAGVGKGMAGYAFGGEAAALMATLMSALSHMESQARTVGQQFARGLAGGIISGTNWIREAARKAALAAKSAAESALKENSPSRVGMEIGGNFAKGISLGVADEAQLRAIRNASRYIATGLSRSVQQAVTQDNRRSYDQRNSGNVTVHVDKLGVSDRQDVRALALEIARLKRRVQFGYGGT